MTSKLVVNTIEADTGISSVSFASSISMSSTSKFHFGDAGIDIGADTNINRPETGVIGFNINSNEKLRISSSGKINIGDTQTSQNILNIEDGTAASMEFASHGTGGDTAYIGVKKSTGGGLTFGISNRDIIFKTGASYSGGTAFDGGTERLRIHSNGDVSCGGAADNNIYNDTSGGGINFKNGGQLVIAKQATSGADPLVWLNDTGQTTNKFLLFAQDGTEKASIGLAGNDLRFARDGYNETLRIDSSGRLLVNTTTTYSSNQMMIVKGASPTSGGNRPYDGQLAIESNETSGAINTGGVLAFIGHDGGTARGFGSIRNLKEDGTSGNYGTYMSFETRANGSAPAEKIRITSGGKLLVGTTGNSGAIIQIGNHTFSGTHFAYNNNRVGFQNNGNLTCISNCSTYNDGTYPGYGLVLVQGASTSSYNVWGICPDGPAKGNSLNLHYGAQATNIHEPNKSQFEFTGNGYFLKPNNPAFHARPPGNYAISGDQIIGGTWSTGDSESFVRGTLTNGTSIWNNSTGIFTVPVTGIYYLHWSVFLKNNTTRRDAMIYRNGTGSGNIIARTEIGTPNSSTANNKNVAVSTVVSLSVNDTIRFGCLTSGSTNTIYQTVRPWSYACGYLIG